MAQKKLNFNTLCLGVAVVGVVIFLFTSQFKFVKALSGSEFLSILFEYNKLEGLLVSIIFLVPALIELRLFFTQKGIINIPREKVAVVNKINKYDRPICAALAFFTFFYFMCEDGISLTFGGVLYFLLALAYAVLSIDNLKPGFIENKINEILNKK